jgi:VanZ family protein
MNQWRERAASTLFLIAWMGVIYFLSDQANSNQLTQKIFGNLNYFVRKGAHMAEYAIFFWLSLRFQSSFAKHNAQSYAVEKPLRRLLLPFLFTFLFAASDEWHQSFVPGRSALFSDVMIDTCGAGIAALVSFLSGKRTKK